MILVFHIFRSERGNSNELLQLCQRYLVSGYWYKAVIKRCLSEDKSRRNLRVKLIIKWKFFSDAAF